MNYQALQSRQNKLQHTSPIIRQSIYWYATRTTQKVPKVLIFIYKLFGNYPRSIKVRISNWRIKPNNLTQQLIIEMAYALLYNYIDIHNGNISKLPINPQLYDDMQAEFVRVVLNVSGSSKEAIKKDIEILIKYQQEILDFQERKNRKNISEDKFVLPIIIITSFFVVFGFSIPQDYRWSVGLLFTIVVSLMSHKSEIAGSDELLYEKTILVMLENLKVD
jgi:hypothetical protein